MKLLLRATEHNPMGLEKKLEGVWSLTVLAPDDLKDNTGVDVTTFILEEQLLPKDIKEGDDIVITIERAT